MANTEKTLHAAEFLTMDNIKIQKKMYEGGLKTVDEQYRFEQNNLGLNSEHFMTYGLKKHAKNQQSVSDDIYMANQDPDIIKKFKARMAAKLDKANRECMDNEMDTLVNKIAARMVN